MTQKTTPVVLDADGKPATPAPLPGGNQITPMDMLNTAIEQNADLEKLQQLMDLQERWETNQARKAFVAAMQKFKADPPIVIKDKRVQFSGTEYTHASHAQVTTAIAEKLSEVGITHHWEVEQSDTQIKVTCVLTHIDGYSARTRVEAPADTSGSKNAIQAIASAITYLQRYTLLSATGIATVDDDDGRGAGGGKDLTPISEKQLSTLLDMLDSTGADQDKFRAYFKIDRLEDLPAAEFQRALNGLREKQKRGKKNANS